MTRRLGRNVGALIGAFGLCLTTGVIAVPSLSSVQVVSAAPTSPTDVNKIPHYFGPYANWANSPQVLADTVVTLSAPAAGGVQAEATATVAATTGVITGITITAPGSGYLTPPTVTFASPGVTPTTVANATATISTGVISSITVVEPGFGFTTPTATISAPPITGTQATAVASGGVDNLVWVPNPGGVGNSYLIQPIVTFTGPQLAGGATATATAVMDPLTGIVTDVTLVNPGSGYTTAPTVTIIDAAAQNPQPTIPATAVATIGVNLIDVNNGGDGYVTPTVTITDSVAPFDKNASATAIVATAGAVSGITLVAPGFGGAGYITPGIKKFVDTLAGLGPSAPNTLGQYIPVAVPDTTTYPGSDYYEIALVQYRQRFSSSLPATGTLLRGYVQISTNVVPGAHIQLTNANLNPAQAPTPIAGYFGVDMPRYLGPTIVATKDRPVRVLFRNLLPTGVAGDLFLPVDTSLMGSGMGPNAVMLDPTTKVPMDMIGDPGTVLDGVRNPACGETPKPRTCYLENRATLHLHGGVTPWISDGTPHQWITPAGDALATDYPKGVSVSNVPDMPDPGDGSQTFFYTNQQSARLMFYHDHAWGITRLNVYAGEAAGYVVTDPMEASLIATGGALNGLGGPNGLGTPLIIQDKTFVPSPATDRQRRPDLELRQVGRRGQPVDPARLHACAEPRRPVGHELVRTLDVRPMVLATGEGRQVSTDRQPLLRPGL